MDLKKKKKKKKVPRGLLGVFFLSRWVNRRRMRNGDVTHLKVCDEESDGTHGLYQDASLIASTRVPLMYHVAYPAYDNVISSGKQPRTTVPRWLVRAAKH